MSDSSGREIITLQVRLCVRAGMFCLVLPDIRQQCSTEHVLPVGIGFDSSAFVEYLVRVLFVRIVELVASRGDGAAIAPRAHLQRAPIAHRLSKFCGFLLALLLLRVLLLYLSPCRIEFRHV